MSRSTRLTVLAVLVALAPACGGGAGLAALLPGRSAGPLELQAPGSRLVTASPAAVAEVARLTARVAGVGTDEERAARVVRWVHAHVAFTADRHAALDGILEDRKGNCYDHASLVIAMLRAGGLRVRFVRELNVEPPSEERAASAWAQQSSLFGFEHNDHTWVEVFAEGRWIPADSSLGLFGMREWLGARVLRGVANDYGMITPFVLVAFDGDAALDRTRDYLETELAEAFPVVTQSAAWSQWREDVASLARSSALVFGPPPGIAPDAATIHRIGSAVADFRRSAAHAGEAAGAASPLDFYLHPSEAAGSRYCLDPESRFLRAALRRPAPNADDLVDARLLEADVVFLREALAKLYSGWPELAQHPSFDVERHFAEWRERLRDGPGTQSFAEGVLDPSVKLRQALTDFHFGVAGWTDRLAVDPRLAFVEYQAALDAPPDLATCQATDGRTFAPGTLRVSRRLGRTGAKKWVTLSAHDVGETFALTCGSAPLVLARRPAADPPPTTDASAAYEQRRIGNATVVAIRSFRGGSPDAVRQLEQFVADYPAHARSRLLVFDLRGNPGGDDHYVLDWLARAHRGEWQGYTELSLAGGALYPCSTWNAVVRQQIVVGRVDEPAARDERAGLRAQWSAPRPSVQVLDPGRVVDRAEHPYTGRAVILVDRFTKSAGESAAFMLQQALGAPVVGERTGGYLEHGNNRVLVLPHTQLVWWYGTKRNYYAGSVEGVGLPVDVYLDDTSVSIEDLLPLLRGL